MAKGKDVARAFEHWWKDFEPRWNGANKSGNRTNIEVHAMALVAGKLAYNMFGNFVEATLKFQQERLIPGLLRNNLEHPKLLFRAAWFLPDEEFNELRTSLEENTDELGDISLQLNEALESTGDWLVRAYHVADKQSDAAAFKALIHSIIGLIKGYGQAKRLYDLWRRRTVQAIELGKHLNLIEGMASTFYTFSYQASCAIDRFEYAESDSDETEDSKNARIQDRLDAEIETLGGEDELVPL